MTYLQAVCLALIQGVTELFPISSLGHAVVVPALLGWSLDQSAAGFLPFLVFLHFATAAALLFFFRRDWVALFSGLLGRHGEAYRAQSRHILLLIVVATIPALIVGAALEAPLRRLFGTPRLAAGFLVLNGLLLLAADRLRRNEARALASVAEMTVFDAVVIGVWQCLAFLPGISRSGATIIGGVRRGLGHETSARFSFLIAQPVILAATAHQLLKLRHLPPGASTQPVGVIIAGGIAAGAAALASTAILMRYFRNHEDWAMAPFGFYCLGFGLLSLAWLSL
ncbi:undecaprenyl-diphosphatase [Endobacter medicaginis]|uniref:Undecaprenyl-diphosphatase n=1 Tax=Endobacter medicaginis TaxID=1181271 RepID=A0A839V6B2_9PROT|nr:undecaprenyl-diphosphate phosphatase [Endobacter medicaginis]MBB3174981.1 undecaprenyl-diphosphatase [Endobacter medicaginis]MCX5475904.1 undecaprenyl-diphosphate phosphatase [Endobacter medicaginis]NVN28832.1 undecaprenyl-diphosphate phosphatase [Endobacter medicaginis]